MNGSELVNMCYEKEGLGERVSGSYLAGFLHGHIAADHRRLESENEIYIPNDLDAIKLKELVIKSAEEYPEYLDLDVGTFMYAVFNKYLKK